MFVGSIFVSPGFAARSALLPELSERAGMSLERINSFNGAMHRGAQLVAPPIAGILIAAFGPSPALYIDAASFALSALLVSSFVPAAAHAMRAATEPAASYFSDLRAGLRYVWQDRTLRALLLVLACTTPL